MGWIAAAIVYVGFLLKFPKWTLIATGGSIALAALGLAWIFYASDRETKAYEAEKALVLVTATINEDKCSADYPVRLVVFNKADRPVSSMSVSITPRQQDHSGPPAGIYSDYVSINRIIEPQSGDSFCYTLPNVGKFVREYSRYGLRLDSNVSSVRFRD